MTDIATIQSLKAVDAWIDVINANINGGVRTAFKASRLRFAGSNTQLDRPATASTLPLQFPEPSLVTTNTVIDWTQGAVTSSTETSHLAIQGEGFFLVASPDMIDLTVGSTEFGATKASATGQLLLTRDGEFHTNQYGLLVNSAGYYLVTASFVMNGGQAVFDYDTGTRFGTGAFIGGSGIRAVFNDLDNTYDPINGPQGAVSLKDYLNNKITQDISGNTTVTASSLVKVDGGKQNMTYTQFGSTVFSVGFSVTNDATAGKVNVPTTFRLSQGTATDATILSKSLEASNASMTQSVPELSLAQKLFSALTKVIQINQTNVDSVLNLVR